MAAGTCSCSKRFGAQAGLTALDSHFTSLRSKPPESMNHGCWHVLCSKRFGAQAGLTALDFHFTSLHSRPPESMNHGCWHVLCSKRFGAQAGLTALDFHFTSLHSRPAEVSACETTHRSLQWSPKRSNSARQSPRCGRSRLFWQVHVAEQRSGLPFPRPAGLPRQCAGQRM
jgi:hypothetical protein